MSFFSHFAWNITLIGVVTGGFKDKNMNSCGGHDKPLHNKFQLAISIGVGDRKAILGCLY